MLEAILGILSTASSWINSSNANKNMQQTLSRIQGQNVIPPAITEGWNTLQNENALPGEQQMREEENTMLPTTLNQIKDSVTSGDLMHMVTNLYTKQQAGQREIDRWKVQGQKELDSAKVAYLSGPMAGAQEGQLSNTMNLEMSSALSRQQSSEQSNQYLTNLLKGVGKVGDTDWSALIAGMSKKQKSTAPALNVTSSSGGLSGNTSADFSDPNFDWTGYFNNQ
jgi:hypothetical protein